MFRNDPNVYQLILKDLKDLSPCIICHSWDSRALNFIRDYPSGLDWKPSERPYHFIMPSAFNIGDIIEVGFELDFYRRSVLLQYFERQGNKLRFSVEERRELELVSTLNGEMWRGI